jgi:uncharacterized protein YndB with AHSA1/START domain
MSASPSPNTVQKPSLTLKRRLNAAAEKVYAAWTKPEQIAQWFGPGQVEITRAETDVRVGGRYVLAFKGDDGEEHYVTGVYRAIKPNEMLQFTWAWKTTPERESLVTVGLKPDGDGCILTLTHEQFFDEDARDRHQMGWNGALDKLEKLFA